MAVTQFKTVTWGSDEPYDPSKLNAMVSNTRYLFERSAKMYYAAYGKRKGVAMRLACGSVKVEASNNLTTTATVNFPKGFFRDGSKPVIGTTIVSPYNRRIIETIYGLDGPSSTPDDRGFQVAVTARELSSTINHLVKPVRVHWIAMGWGLSN